LTSALAIAAFDVRPAASAPRTRENYDHHSAAATVLLTRTCAKAGLYVMCQVDEYWIVDVDGRGLEVSRDRHGSGWRRRSTHARGETIAIRAFPGRGGLGVRDRAA
jgi:hypothetical protein